MFKLVLGKGEEPEIKLPTSAGSWKKENRTVSLLNIEVCEFPVWFFFLFVCLVLVGINAIMTVRKKQLELDMEQQTGSK